MGRYCRVLLTHINGIPFINAFMLIFILKFTEITKLLDIPEILIFWIFYKNTGYYGPEVCISPYKGVIAICNNLLLQEKQYRSKIPLGYPIDINRRLENPR